jgi:hypothetical protein
MMRRGTIRLEHRLDIAGVKRGNGNRVIQRGENRGSASGSGRSGRSRAFGIGVGKT